MTESLTTKCPECGSGSLYRDGLRYFSGDEAVQRWLCRNCGYRFSEKPPQKNQEWSINTQPGLTSIRQICAIQKEAKNLDSATEIKTVAGDVEKLPQDAKGLLTKYMAYLERENYYGDTVYLKSLKVLIKDGADLRNPEDVKTKIARHVFKDKHGDLKEWKNGSKILAVYAYAAFCKMEGITWKRPEYSQDDQIIRAPLEADLDALIISTTSKRMAAFLRCLKETYADPGEVLRIEWRDIKENILTIAHPVKGHLTGEYEISGRLLAMLSMLPKTDSRVFPINYPSLENSFNRMRKRVAAKLHRPEIAEISFKGFRHWGGTTIAENTNGNVLIVKRMLRHKCITSSMKYIDKVLKFEPKEFEETTATTVDEIRNLGKTGWQKYDEMAVNGVQVHFYRRPKRFIGGI